MYINHLSNFVRRTVSGVDTENGIEIGTSQVREKEKGTMNEGSREEEENDEKEIAHHE